MDDIRRVIAVGVAVVGVIVVVGYAVTMIFEFTGLQMLLDGVMR